MRGYTNEKCIKLKEEFLKAAGLEKGYTTNELYHVIHNGKETDFYINNSGFIHFVINGQDIILKNNGNLCKVQALPCIRPFCLASQYML